MRKLLIFSLIFFLAACGRNNSGEETNTTVVDIKKDNFFPVTNYLKGQLLDIKQKGISPFKYTTVNGRTDSVIIKLEETPAYAKEFLEPLIDTANLFNAYTETKFLDKTINAFTFTYDLTNPANDSLPLKHWDVYVEPETGKIKRVYIVKKANDGKMLQLTWLPEEYFKTVVLTANADGSSTIEKEEKISWSY